MSVLRFTGLVTVEGYNRERLHVGGVDVIEAIWDAAPRGCEGVIVELGTERFEGELDVDAGEEGYGTYTPGSNPRFYVGQADLLEKLEALAAQDVVLVVAIPDP